jgi:hypothetical protein
MNNQSKMKTLFSIFNITAVRVANWSADPSKPRYRVIVTRDFPGLPVHEQATKQADFETAVDCEVFALQAAAKLQQDDREMV